MLRLLYSLTIVFVGFLVAHAQNTTVQCETSYSWADNSLGQSPCLVAAYLEGACQLDGQWTVQALPGSSSSYSGPTTDQANPCLCSSVTYSLISACADCQNAQVSKWQDWAKNCSILQTSNGQYPHPIPSGTAVPAWAYQAVIGQWSPAAAQAAALQNAPDSSAGPSPTSKSHHLPDPASHTPASPSATTSHSPSSSSSLGGSSSTNLGAIIGGIVGGVLGLALLLALGFWLYYRHFDRSQQTNAKLSGVRGPDDSRALYSPVSPSMSQARRHV